MHNTNEHNNTKITKENTKTSGILTVWTILALLIGGVGGYFIGRSLGFVSGETKEKSVELNNNMRKEWINHIVLTHEYMRATMSDNPDSKIFTDAAMENAENIAGIFGEYYEGDVEQKLSDLFKTHVNLTKDNIEAIKRNDEAIMDNLEESLKNNTNEIANYLNSINPDWDKTELTAMINEHLAFVMGLTESVKDKNTDEELEGIEENMDHIIEMADSFTNGIVNQFKDKFGKE